MRKLLLGLMTATIALSSTIISFAGEWKQTGYGWWYDNDNGSYTANSWQNINNTWYYFNQDGYMQTGWISVNGKWYYCYSSGEMAHDTWVDSVYYVGTDGVMYANTTTPDGYTFDESGKYIEKNTITKGKEKNKTLSLTVDNWDRYVEVKDFSISLSPSRESINRSGHLYPLIHVRMNVRPTEEGKKYTFSDASLTFEVTKGDILAYVYADLNENGSYSYDEDNVEQFTWSFTNGTGLSDLISKSFSKEGTTKYKLLTIWDNKMTPR